MTLKLDDMEAMQRLFPEPAETPLAASVDDATPSLDATSLPKPRRAASSSAPA